MYAIKVQNCHFIQASLELAISIVDRKSW